MRRWPCTISLTRRAGTPISLASWYWLTASGLRNSSSRISPGCAGAIILSAAILPPLSVVVSNFHVLGPGIGPPEADPPLLVDPDAVLTRAIPRQLLQPAAGGTRRS